MRHSTLGIAVLAIVWVVGTGWAPAAAQQLWCHDVDGDGFGNPNDHVMAIQPPPEYVADCSDCNDADPAVNPAAFEVPCDLQDTNCDGQLAREEEDWDGDGYVPCTGDCDDTESEVHPGAAEVCDGIDNDCDGSIDETCQTWCRDLDADNYGDPAQSYQGETPPDGYVADCSDCDDTDYRVNPAQAEICGNAIDDDCNGVIDDGCNPIPVERHTWSLVKSLYE